MISLTSEPACTSKLSSAHGISTVLTDIRRQPAPVHGDLIGISENIKGSELGNKDSPKKKVKGRDYLEARNFESVFRSIRLRTCF